MPRIAGEVGLCPERNSSTARSTSARVNPAMVSNGGFCEMCRMMLKPLDRSSSKMGETPVTNMRARAPVPVPALSAA